MNATTYSVDLASRVFQVHGYDHQGQRVSQQRLSRARFATWCQALSGGQRVVMEATGSAHHWGRVLQAQGAQVKLVPPQHVRALRIGNKTDANDAEAIYEAALRPRVRPVPVKSAEQQALLAEHRWREQLIRERTGSINQIRGLLREFGILLGPRLGAFRRELPALLAEANPALPARAQVLLAEAWDGFQWREARLRQLDARLRETALQTPACRRLLAVEGIGPLTATALVASYGAARNFTRARQFAASLGLTPREDSSGPQRRLGPITKRGNRYLRYLLVHGAQSVVRAAAGKSDPRSQWIQALQARAGTNRTVVAVANKNARIAWALLRRAQPYRPAQR